MNKMQLKVINDSINIIRNELNFIVSELAVISDNKLIKKEKDYYCNQDKGICSNQFGKKTSCLIFCSSKNKCKSKNLYRK